MKVISKIGDSHYLLKVSETELANILGYNSSYSDNFKPKVESAIRFETDLKISGIYSKYHNIKVLQTSDNINKARLELNKILEALTPIEDILNNIPLEE